MADAKFRYKFADTEIEVEGEQEWVDKIMLAVKDAAEHFTPGLLSKL